MRSSSAGGFRGPTRLLAFAVGPRKPSTDSFCNDGSLELSEHTYHLKRRLACRSSRVEPLLVQEQVDAEGV
jgi:hypothetical protein